MNRKLIPCLALVAFHLAARAHVVELKFVSVDSEETNGQAGYGQNAVDGNPDTCWHTQWQAKSPGPPHEIVIELVPPSLIKGFTYLPRQDESDHGTIKDYEFYVSDDGTNFGEPVKKGAFEPDKEKKTEIFEPLQCRFIKLRAMSEIHGLPWTSAAEVGVIENGDNTDLMTNQIHEAMSLLAQFALTKSVAGLQNAFRAVERISPPGVDRAVPLPVARRAQTKVWLNLLAIIDENLDRNFDANNPTNWVAINSFPADPRYPSGVKPGDIQDPEISQPYQAALRQNDEKLARFNLQTGLHNIDELADIDVDRFFSTYFTSSEADQAELDELMRQAELSPAQVEKIKALFHQ